MSRLTEQTFQKRMRIMKYITAALALVLIVLQFIPFWGCYQCKTCGEGKIISINEYVWMANEHKTGLTSILKTYYIPGFAAMDVVATSFLIQLAGIAAIVFAFVTPKKLTALWLGLISGLSCVLGYLLQPAYQMGQLWQLHIGVGAALILAVLTGLGMNFTWTYNKAKAELAQEAAAANL